MNNGVVTSARAGSMRASAKSRTAGKLARTGRKLARAGNEFATCCRFFRRLRESRAIIKFILAQPGGVSSSSSQNEALDAVRATKKREGTRSLPFAESCRWNMFCLGKHVKTFENL